MKKLLLSISCLMTSSIAFAGGFQLQEYSLTNQGRSFAGAGVVGDDYSAIAFNPAGMQLKDSGLQFGGTYAHIRSTMHGDLTDNIYGTTSGTGEFHSNKFVPHFFGQKRVNDRVVIGAGTYIPFGLGTYYNDKDWFGASHAINSEITALDFAVAASVKLTEQWSIGASWITEYLEARLTSAGSDMSANDHTEPGYSLGIMYQPQPNTRFGVSYRSKISHKFSGTHKLDKLSRHFEGDCGATLNLPEHVLISAFHKIGKWGFSGMARWTRWSRFDTLKIHSEAYRQMTSLPGLGPATSNTEPVYEDWKNVWMIGAGVDYDINNNWTLRTGFAWDEGAVKRPETRTARVPDTNRWVASFGASYKKNNWQYDFGYTHVFLRHGNVNNRLDSLSNNRSYSTLKGKYRMGIDLVGLSAQYNF